MISTISRPAEQTVRSEKSHDSSLRQAALSLLHREIQFISNQSFHCDAADSEILVVHETCEKGMSESAMTSVPNDLPAHLARLCETELLSAKQERYLFRKMNYLKFRANVIRSSLDPEFPDPHAIETVESFLAEAQAVRDHIVKANTRLVISIVKKFAGSQLSFDEMLSDGIFCLMRCVDKFDYDRGYRFSTYAFGSIVRNTHGKIADQQKQSARFISNVNSSDGSAFDVENKENSEAINEQTWSSLKTVISKLINKLDRREQFILRGRYALGGNVDVRTFQSLADKLGVSKERVRQLEQRAVKKLRVLAADTDLEAMCDFVGN